MAVQNPCHPGDPAGQLGGGSVRNQGGVAPLGCTRQALSRLLNGKAGISPAMALALERIGWSNASFWMRLQVAYALAQERRRQAGMSSRMRACAPRKGRPSSGGRLSEASG